MPNLDTFTSRRDQSIIDFREQQARDDSERETAEAAKSELTECRELVEALADKAVRPAMPDGEKYAARFGYLTTFLAYWAMKIPEIKADLEKQVNA